MSFTQLSHKQLVLVSKVSREIKKETGINIKLNDDNIIGAIDEVMKNIGNLDIQNIYKKLQQELGLINTSKTEKNTKTMTYRGASIDVKTEASIIDEKPRKKMMYRGQEIG